MKTENEIKEMIQKLWKIEERARSHLKEDYRNAYEVLEWVLGRLPEEEVTLFGE